jgi:hypothetical protein
MSPEEAGAERSAWLQMREALSRTTISTGAFPSDRHAKRGEGTPSP